MAERQIYFQWQNEVLEKTIYPLRRMNLRNALEYFMEIDLWAQYKSKTIADLPTEITAYHNRKKLVITKAVADYKDVLAYFMRDYVNAASADKPVDAETLKRLAELHAVFKTYYESLKDARKESYFISQRLEVLDKVRVQLDKDSVMQMRRVNAIKATNPNHPKLPAETQRLETLQNSRPAIEAERNKLKDLISAHEKLASRKLDFAKKVEMALKQQKELETRLAPIQQRINMQAAKLKEMQDEVQRLRTQPERASVEKYFSILDVVDDIRQRFQQIDQEVTKKINELHRYLSALKDDAVKLVTLKNQIFNMQLEKTRFERRTGVNATFKENTVKAFEDELNRLKDFKLILENAKRTPAELTQIINSAETQIAQVQQALAGPGTEAGALKSQLDALDDVLFVTEEKYVSEYTPVQPSVKEIVLLKLDEYKATLLELDQYQLLALLVARFKSEPQRYPRWLQYMIVHFSGMRYASAHGSWADPKDLYLNLRTSAIEEDVKHLDDDGVMAMCNQKLVWYQPTVTAGEPLPGPKVEPPKLASAQVAKWKDKVVIHLARMKMDNPYSRRAGLLNLLLDEESYAVDAMTVDEALAELEQIKDTLPDWMWKEISAVTNLRLKEAKDATWEKLTPDQQQQRSSAEAAKYREIMNKWKQDHLTGWRKEHEQNAEMVVSRAVCNEVAEFIQHLRGHVGGAGLASKPDWYRGEENKAKGSTNPDKAYYIKPRKAEDYRVGASILWVRYRNDPPPMWNEVKDSTTSGGDRLVPPAYLSGTTGSAWTYKGGGTVRTNSVTRKPQYLGWLHEATVAAIAETAEGRVILTYETSLPYEDRRLSCVGLFKHTDYNLLYDGGEETYNGSFVGYVPENPAGIPTKDLDDMLNWEHVLLKS